MTSSGLQFEVAYRPAMTVLLYITSTV